MKLLALLLCIALTGCATTPSQQAKRQQILAQFNAFAVQAKPLVDVAIEMAAASQGVPPSTTAAALSAGDQLYGMASAAWAGQPPAQGTNLSTLATAVIPLLPKNADSATMASILTSAAAQAQGK